MLNEISPFYKCPIQEKIDEMRANEAKFLKELAFIKSLTPDEKEFYNKLRFEETIARMRKNAIDIKENTNYWKKELSFRKSLTPDEKELYNKLQFEEKIKEMRANEAKNKPDLNFS